MPINFLQNALVAVLALPVVAGAAACGDDDASTGGGATDAAEAEAAATSGEGLEGTLRLGYFPNVTHAPAILGVEDGLFAEALGPGVDLQLDTFNSGTEAVEALFGGSIDASFLGPNPAINGFAQSGGEALRIVAGTTSGGAALVVSEDIRTPGDLEGSTVASPSLGNTQDVALRAWLRDEGYEIDSAGGGDVEIVPQSNADSLTAFRDGAIDGAWVPEPWATRLVQEGGGHVLVDEADLWPEGRFVTTHLAVATDYLDEHPDIVKALLTGLLDAVDAANGEPEASQATVNDGIEAVTTKRLEDATMSSSWENLEFTTDPIAASLEASKDDAVEAGFIEDADLAGIYDLTLLNELLADRGDEEAEGL